MLRQLEVYDPLRQAYVTLARTTAASLDRLEADPQRSEHVVATVARVHGRCLEQLGPASGVVPDVLDVLAAELAEVVHRPAVT